jgi:hypothetical protein
MSNRRRVRSGRRAHRMEALADIAGLKFEPNHEASVWLREALSELQDRIFRGMVRICPHLSPGMPVMTALWAPDQLVCIGCLDKLRTAGDDDRRCDRCSVVAEAGQIHPAMTSLDPAGSLLVLLGLCHTCSKREVAA